MPLNAADSGGVSAMRKRTSGSNAADAAEHTKKRHRMAPATAAQDGAADGSAASAAEGGTRTDAAMPPAAVAFSASTGAADEQPANGSRSPSPPSQTAAEAVQAKAVQLLSEGAFGRALAAASAATKLPGGTELEAGLATLRLICRLHLAGPTATCWQVLGLAEGAAGEDTRRAFRRGAQRVHPDKCRLPRAEAAFKTLAAAAERALAAGGTSSGAVADVAADMGGGFDNSGGGAAWWQEWEPTAAESRQQRQQEAPRRRAWQPPADSDAQILAGLATQALRAEVVRRQSAVLSPKPGSDEAAMDPSIRQARLREARSILAIRLKEEEAAAFADTAGGFQREPSQFAARGL